VIGAGCEDLHPRGDKLYIYKSRFLKWNSKTAHACLEVITKTIK